MSVFKVREWWSVGLGLPEKFGPGNLFLADIDPGSKGYQEIIVCDYDGCLRIYQPRSLKSENGWTGFKANDLLCEVDLKLPVLQIASGNFTQNSTVQLAVLHPFKLSVFSFTGKMGAASHLFEYKLVLKYEHKLSRSAFNFCHGHFGKAKGRELICVQSLDGTLSIFDQNKFLFLRFLPNAVLSGPLAYCQSNDSFLTVSSARQLECYRYHILLVSADAKSREESDAVSTSKRVKYDWAFNLSEEAIQITLMTVRKRTDIAVLGEQNIFVFSQDGKLTIMMRLDYSPTCFYPYSSAMDNSFCCIVGTFTKTLRVYQNTRLVWAAALQHAPCQIRVASFITMKGLIVTIGDDGVLLCSYMGTSPLDLVAVSSLKPILQNKDNILSELTKLEEKIDKLEAKQEVIPETNQGPSEMVLSKIDDEKDEVTLTVNLPASLDKKPVSSSEVKGSDQVPSISALVQLKAKAGTTVSNVKVLVNVESPLSVYKSVHVIPVLDQAGTVLTSTFFMMSCLLPSSLDASFVATFINQCGNQETVSLSISLPLALVVKTIEPPKSEVHKLTFQVDRPMANLKELFSDLVVDENTDNQRDVLGFQYYGQEPVVSLMMGRNSQKCHLQCSDFSYMWHIANELVSRFITHSTSSLTSSLPSFVLTCDGQLPLKSYFDVIHQYFKGRQLHSDLEKELENHATQFRKIQTKLLMKMKDLMPTKLDNLEMLLAATHSAINETADKMERNALKIMNASACLSCATRLFLMCLKSLHKFESEEWLEITQAFSSLTDVKDNQGWEENTVHALETLIENIRLKKRGEVPPKHNASTFHSTMDALKISIKNLCSLLLKFPGANSVRKFTKLQKTKTKPLKPSSQLLVIKPTRSTN